MLSVSNIIVFSRGRYVHRIKILIVTFELWVTSDHYLSLICGRSEGGGVLSPPISKPSPSSLYFNQFLCGALSKFVFTWSHSFHLKVLS
jgi:hypothetical protein